MVPNQFGGESEKNEQTTPSFIASAFHNELEDRNADKRYDMAMTPLQRLEI